MRRRLLQSSVLVFGLALVASLSVHLPVYSALGALAEVLLRPDEAEHPRPAMELVEFEVDDSVQTPPPKPPRAEREAEPDKRRARPQPQRTRRPAKKQPRRKVQPKVEVVPKPEPERPKPPPVHQEKHAIKQRSDDPDVEPPENSRFIAEENRRVEEETVASVTNLEVDEPKISPGAQKNPSDDEQLGNDERWEAAHNDEREGDPDRNPEGAGERPKPEPRPGAEAPEQVAQAAKPGVEEPDPRTQRADPAPKEAGGEKETLVVNDAHGSFVIRRRPQGSGPGSRGGEAQRAGASKNRDSRRGSGRRSGDVDLSVSWKQFEQVVGSEELERQREQYAERRRSRSPGRRRSRLWRRFRGAIENYVAHVRPGNQTALNAARSPFAAYLAAVHRRLHPQFAGRFLASLPMVSGPFSDMSLHATLEIAFNRNGSVHKVGIVRTSGFLPFDYGAFSSVLRAQPYPEAPSDILSADGRVYVRWGFYRNARQCGTFNAEPYILKDTPDMPPPSKGPFDDPGVDEDAPLPLGDRPGGKLSRWTPPGLHERSSKTP